MFSFVVPCQFQIVIRGLSCFLNETMQENHPRLLVDIKEYARNPVLA